MNRKGLDLEIKIPPAEYDVLYSEYSKDLEAFFKVLYEDVLKTIEDNSDKTPEEIISEVSKILS